MEEKRNKGSGSSLKRVVNEVNFAKEVFTYGCKRQKWRFKKV